MILDKLTILKKIKEYKYLNLFHLLVLFLMNMNNIRILDIYWEYIIQYLILLRIH